MRKQASKFFLLLSLSIVFSSCNMNSIYDEQVAIEECKWYKDEMARFDLVINDTIQLYNFYLNIRNNTDYRYSNLYVFLKTEFPNNNISRDTIECLLANVEGKWLGKGWGKVKENEFLLSSNMRFPLKGKYEFVIQHAMRTDTLNGIQNIGIRIAKSE